MLVPLVEEEIVSKKTSSLLKHQATSTDHQLAEANYLDDHYICLQPEYEAMLRYVGMELGWTVLDAGCGGGSYIPLLAETVGVNGRVHAIDLAPENIEAVKARTEGLSCPVQARVGEIMTMPYADNTFDALWCANVIQYLTEKELATLLREFYRVV